jgi:hypothetical protein
MGWQLISAFKLHCAVVFFRERIKRLKKKGVLVRFTKGTTTKY